MTRDEQCKLIAEHVRKLLPKELEIIDVDYEIRNLRFIVYWRSCDYKNKSDGKSYFSAGAVYVPSKDWKYKIETEGYNFVKDVWNSWNKIINSDEYEFKKGD